MNSRTFINIGALFVDSFYIAYWSEKEAILNGQIIPTFIPFH
jgi:hypothetical protein